MSTNQPSCQVPIGSAFPELGAREQHGAVALDARRHRRCTAAGRPGRPAPCRRGRPAPSPAPPGDQRPRRWPSGPARSRRRRPDRCSRTSPRAARRRRQRAGSRRSPAGRTTTGARRVPPPPAPRVQGTPERHRRPSSMTSSTTSAAAYGHRRDGREDSSRIQKPPSGSTSRLTVSTPPAHSSTPTAPQRTTLRIMKCTIPAVLAGTAAAVSTASMFAPGRGAAPGARDAIGLTGNGWLIQFEYRRPGRLLVDRPGRRARGRHGTDRHRLPRAGPAGCTASATGAAFTRLAPDGATPPRSASSRSPLYGTNFGVDFNPAADRLRIVSDTGQNLRHDLNPGGAHGGRRPPEHAAHAAPTTGITAAAYTNNDHRHGDRDHAVRHQHR